MNTDVRYVVGWMPSSVKSICPIQTNSAQLRSSHGRVVFLKDPRIMMATTNECEWSCRSGPSVHQIGRDKSIDRQMFLRFQIDILNDIAVMKLRFNAGV